MSSSSSSSMDDSSIDDSISIDSDCEDVPLLRYKLLEREKKLFDASVTIESLIGQFTEYRKSVEEQEAQLSEALAEKEQALRDEKEATAALNAETISNLKTLMMELELIENRNNELSDELRQERSEHEQALQSLAAEREAREELETRLAAAQAAGALGQGGDAAASGLPDDLLTPRKVSAGGTAIGVDQSSEVLRLRRKKDELANRLLTERRVMVEVTALVSQLNSALGSSPAIAEAVSSTSGGAEALERLRESALAVPEDGGAGASRAAGSGKGTASSNERSGGRWDRLKGDRVKSGEKESTFSRFKDTIQQLEETRAVAMEQERARAEYRCEDEHLVRVRRELPGPVLCLTQVGSHVWLGTSNGYIDLIDAATGETVSSTRHRSAAVHTLVEAGGFVWSTSTDGQVAVFNAKTGKIVCTVDAHRGKVAAVVSLLPDKPMVWSIGADMVIRVWNTTQPFACEKELSAQSYMISMCYHLGVVWIGTESAILRYNIQSYRKMDMLTRGGASIPCVNCLVSLGEYVWSLAGDNIIDIWAPTGERIKRIEHTQRMLSIAAVGPDQIWVCSSSSIRAMTADAEVIHTIKKPHYDATKAVVHVVVRGDSAAAAAAASAATSDADRGKDGDEADGGASASGESGAVADNHFAWSGSSDRTMCVWKLPQYDPSQAASRGRTQTALRVLAVEAEQNIAGHNGFSGEGRSGGGPPSSGAQSKMWSRLRARKDSKRLQAHLAQRSNPTSVHPSAVRTQIADEDVDAVLLLMKDPVTGVPLKEKKISLGKKKANAFSGKEVVDWMTKNIASVRTRADAVDLANRLYAEHHIICVSSASVDSFRDDKSVWQYSMGFNFLIRGKDGPDAALSVGDMSNSDVRSAPVDAPRATTNFESRGGSMYVAAKQLPPSQSGDVTKISKELKMKKMVVVGQIGSLQRAVDDGDETAPKKLAMMREELVAIDAQLQQVEAAIATAAPRPQASDDTLSSSNQSTSSLAALDRAKSSTTSVGVPPTVSVVPDEKADGQEDELSPRTDVPPPMPPSPRDGGDGLGDGMPLPVVPSSAGSLRPASPSLSSATAVTTDGERSGESLTRSADSMRLEGSGSSGSRSNMLRAGSGSRRGSSSPGRAGAISPSLSGSKVSPTAHRMSKSSSRRGSSVGRGSAPSTPRLADLSDSVQELVLLHKQKKYDEVGVRIKELPKSEVKQFKAAIEGLKRDAARKGTAVAIRYGSVSKEFVLKPSATTASLVSKLGRSFVVPDDGRAYALYVVGKDGATIGKMTNDLMPLDTHRQLLAEKVKFTYELREDTDESDEEDEVASE